MIDRARIVEALEAAALAVALHGPAAAPLFARMERALADADAAERDAQALQDRAAAMAARRLASRPLKTGGRRELARV